MREYDIRGIVGETLSVEDAYHLGLAYAGLLGETGKVAIGRDGRHSSPELEQALAEGLSDAGLDVLRIGVGPTPMLYFSVFHHDLAGGIMVTGSHNPPTHNGFKLMLGKKAIYGEDIRKLGDIAKAGKWPANATKGAIEQEHLLPTYIATVSDAYRDNSRPIRAVWDAGNGAAGEVMAPAMQKTCRASIPHSLLRLMAISLTTTLTPAWQKTWPI